jgi:hypothetical protein
MMEQQQVGNLKRKRKIFQNHQNKKRGKNAPFYYDTRLYYFFQGNLLTALPISVPYRMPSSASIR